MGFIYMLNSDIALIQLPQTVEFSELIQPISFVCSSDKGMDVIAIGNGRMKDSDRTAPPILQYTELMTVSMLKCLGNFPFLIFRESAICVKGKQQKSTCHGDSGGPLVWMLNNSLIGVTSFSSSKGCESGYPMIFSRISFYNDWIRNVSAVECNKKISKNEKIMLKKWQVLLA